MRRLLGLLFSDLDLAPDPEPASDPQDEIPSFRDTPAIAPGGLTPLDTADSDLDPSTLPHGDEQAGVGDPPPGPDMGGLTEPPPTPAYPPAHTVDDASTISVSRILAERPDVLRGFYETFYGAGNDSHSTAWMKRVGADTPEAYAKYWYEQHGKYEGYNQGPTTAQDNVSLEKILQDRPDVLRAYYSEYYGPHNDRHSDAWVQRVGGTTPEDYAKYWYNKYGKWEGYSQTDKAASENIDVQRLLQDRPDVFRAYYTEYYGPHNDRHSHAWIDRVGGETVEDYAKYWYVTYGKGEGYTQTPSQPAEAATQAGMPTTEPESWEAPRVEDPSLDPWNHPAIYPDAQRPPDVAEIRDGAPTSSEIAAASDALLSVGQSLQPADPLV